MARSARVSVKLTVAKKKEFEETANRFGVSTSMLGACVIGKWLSDREEEKKRPPVVSAVNYGPGVPE